MQFNLKTLVAGTMIASMAFAAQAQDAATDTQTSPSAGTAEARKAPAFTLKDETGQEHKLADFAGKPLVMMWTRPGSVEGDSLKDGCPFIVSRVKEGTIERLAAKVKSEGGVFVAVNSASNNTPEQSKAVREKFNQTYPTLQDADGSVGREYGARTTPHLFVVGPEGNIVYDGALNDNKSADADKDANAKDYVTAAVTAAKAGQAPEVSKTQPYGCGIKYKD